MLHTPAKVLPKVNATPANAAARIDPTLASPRTTPTAYTLVERVPHPAT